MSTKISHVGSVAGIEGGVKRAGKKAAFSPVMEALTRVGYGVRGLIYIMMGILALTFTLGKGGAPVDPKGAIAAIGKSAGRYGFTLGSLDRPGLLCVMGCDPSRVRSAA